MKNINLIIVFLLNSYTVLALDDIGQNLNNIIQNFNSRFLIVFILFFILMYGIFSASLNRLDLFKGSKIQPNRFGKVVSFSLSLMTTISLAYFYPGIDEILSFAGVYGGIVLAIFIFGLTYFNLKGKKKTLAVILISFGISFVTYSLFAGPDKLKTFMSLGTTLILIGIILFILNLKDSDESDVDRYSQRSSSNPYSSSPSSSNTSSSPTKTPSSPSSKVPNYSLILNKINSLCNNYDNIYKNQLLPQCNKVLQINHLYLNPGYYYGTHGNPPVSSNDWNTIYTIINQLNQLKKDISDLISKITNDSAYPKISSSQNSSLQSYLGLHSKQLSKTKNSHQKFITYYNAGHLGPIK